MDLSLSKSVELYFKDLSYIKKTFMQIQRDFDMTGIPLEWDKVLPKDYQEFYQLIFRNIHELIRQDHPQFKNLLYRIDVSEKEIHRRMATKADVKLEEEISRLIIERCLLKVLTREKYSQ